MARTVVRIKAAGRGVTRPAALGWAADHYLAAKETTGEQHGAAQAAVRRIAGELAAITEEVIGAPTVVIRNAPRTRSAKGHRKGRLHRAINR